MPGRKYAFPQLPPQDVAFHLLMGSGLSLGSGAVEACISAFAALFSGRLALRSALPSVRRVGGLRGCRLAARGALRLRSEEVVVRSCEGRLSCYGRFS